jgi:hypothetical protein
MNNQLNAQHINNIRFETTMLYPRINFAILQNFPLPIKTEAFMRDVKTVREPARIKTASGKPAIQDRPGSSNLQTAVQKTTVKTSHCKQR